MAVCYILRCVDGSYYVGSTDDLDARLVKHRDGSASGFTAARRPVALAYSEVLDSIEAARARERQLKGWTHAKKDALTQADAGRLKVLSRSNSPLCATSGSTLRDRSLVESDREGRPLVGARLWARRQLRRTGG